MTSYLMLLQARHCASNIIYKLIIKNKVFYSCIRETETKGQRRVSYSHAPHQICVRIFPL